MFVNFFVEVGVVIKVVKIYACLEVFAEGFRDLFTKPIHESFSHELVAIVVSDNHKTVRGLHKMLADNYEDKKDLLIILVF